ncbi:hypothetical protein [Paenibacillus xylanexedens]|uniref:hypothetical protein n=1 Tax=Paenibacillus xylanexedens TaxID=528191 RepID=UPI00119DF9D0|nr:hypothetical protein [Paenibacillus xylanexedens]
MNLLENIKFKLESVYLGLRHKIEVWHYSSKYPDYIDNEYNLGHLKHIWGIKSGIDFTSNKAHFYTMNDIEIIYSRKDKLYSLSVETALGFDNKSEECEYLQELLGYFTDFMSKNNYSSNFVKTFFCSSPIIINSAETIEELYINFKMYVDGYCSVYGKDD